MIYISLIVNELYRDNFVKHINFYIASNFLLPFNV